MKIIFSIILSLIAQYSFGDEPNRHENFTEIQQAVHKWCSKYPVHGVDAKIAEEKVIKAFLGDLTSIAFLADYFERSNVEKSYIWASVELHFELENGNIPRVTDDSDTLIFLLRKRIAGDYEDAEEFAKMLNTLDQQAHKIIRQIKNRTKLSPPNK